MANFTGSFTNYKNENLDEFYAAIGMPVSSAQSFHDFFIKLDSL